MDKRERNLSKKEKRDYKNLLSELEAFAKSTKNFYARMKYLKWMEHGEKKPVIQVYDERLEISGLHVKHTVYYEPQVKGFIRDDEAIEEAVKKRKESLEVRKKLDDAIEDYRKRFPNATKDDYEALEELAKILAEYKDLLHTREDNEHRRINEFKNLVNANWDQWTHFITLTFKENLTDIDAAQKIFSAWVKKMEKEIDDFIYVCVKEFQARGSIHFHLLVRMKRIPKKEFSKVRAFWTDLHEATGNIDFKTIKLKYVPVEYQDPDEWKSKEERQIWSLGNYLTSYLKKGATDPRLFGRKLFTSSSRKKLKEKIVLTDKEKIHEFLTAIKTHELKEKTYKVKEKHIENNQVVTSDNDIGEMHFYNILIKKTEENN